MSRIVIVILIYHRHKPVEFLRILGAYLKEAVVVNWKPRLRWEDCIKMYLKEILSLN
jgi:hypothetical protein